MMLKAIRAVLDPATKSMIVPVSSPSTASDRQDSYKFNIRIKPIHPDNVFSLDRFQIKGNTVSGLCSTTTGSTWPALRLPS